MFEVTLNAKIVLVFCVFDKKGPKRVRSELFLVRAVCFPVIVQQRRTLEMCPSLTLRYTTTGVDIFCICKGGRSDHHDRQDLCCKCTSATDRTPCTHGAHLVDGVQAGVNGRARGGRGAFDKPLAELILAAECCEPYALCWPIRPIACQLLSAGNMPIHIYIYMSPLVQGAGT